MSQKTGSLKMGDGVCHWIRDGAITVKKYEGKFSNDSLEDKAQTGKWYCSVMGHPQSCEGEGDTPELAVKDAIARNDELQAKLQEINMVLGTFSE